MAVREIAFELECFEWADERLEVAGRWKGLAGRRLNRPVLTVDVEGGRRKHLVALPGGHVGAAEGTWRAAFDWPGDPADITSAELEMGGSVVVDLPLPDRRRRRRRRPAADAGDEALRAEAGALRGQVERLRAELAARERENMRLSAQLDEEPGEQGDKGDAGAPTVEIERLSSRQQELTAELERLAGERDHTRAELSTEVERLQAERAELAAEVQRLHGEHDRTTVELERLRDEGERSQSEIDDLREAFSEAAAEAEESRDRHRAELAALEKELRAERAAVARLTTQLATRPELPPPATESARRAATAPAGDETQPLPPATFDAPGPLRAGGRPADQPGAEHEPRHSRIPAWLRGGRRSADEDPGADETVAAETDEVAPEEPSEGEGSPDPAADETVADETRPDGGAGPDDAAAPARAATTAAAARHAVARRTAREHGAKQAPGRRVAGENGAREDAEGGPAMPSLRAIKARLESIFASNGHAVAADEPGSAHEEALPGPRRSASAARARAGATVAARRSPVELWALRILAAALVAVLLIAFLLILTSIA
jgi:predicted  nucleic acid-binding Zn-ribbon protein